MTSIDSPSPVDVSAIVDSIIGLLTPLTVFHASASCDCGVAQQDSGECWVNQCKDFWNTSQKVVTEEVVRYLPGPDAETLQHFLATHPEAMTWPLHGLHKSTLVALHSAIVDRIRCLVQEWVEGCFVAWFFQTQVAVEVPESSEWSDVEAFFAELVRTSGYALYPYWRVEGGKEAFCVWTGFEPHQLDHILKTGGRLRWRNGHLLTGFAIEAAGTHGLSVRVLPENEKRQFGPGPADSCRVSIWGEEVTTALREVSAYINDHFASGSPFNLRFNWHLGDDGEDNGWELVLFGDDWESESDEAAEDDH